MENNRYWMSAIQTKMRDGINMMKDYDQLVNGTTSQDIANMAKAILQGAHKEVVQLPE